MKILVIDDEPQIRRALRVGLEQNNYQVFLAANGEEGLDMAASRLPDLIILDLAMPGKNGFDVCKELREWTKTPIIVLSVRDREEDKIKALDLGADDYLTKPFGIGELLARARAVLRRQAPDEEQEQSTFTCANLKVDFAHRRVYISNEEVHLTPKEYDLLRYMTTNADRVLTHRQLLSKVWGPEYENDSHTLRVHIANLRNKIEEHPERPFYIHTETRVGYRFRTDQQATANDKATVGV
ncbi:MAG: response regulator transcription factor [Candidatus Obscuribacterales bacterium]|nr:response regulator transcription factor [Cyanobacteria bacterium SZAS LIN-5]RTL39235.1 MAG: response regulator transcription factor [Candidatus Melainabacteria bacterium]